MERDKRTPKASLPGADLVGFETIGDQTRLALGEVKTSTDANSPPNVMNGRSGMTHQIDNLATNLTLINQLLKVVVATLQRNSYENSFNAAITLFLDSGNKAIALFGVLIRDTEPNEQDLRSRGETLAGTLGNPTTCHLVAIYLPCAISELPRDCGRWFMSHWLLEKLDDARQEALKQAGRAQIHSELLNEPFSEDAELIRRSADGLEMAVLAIIIDGKNDDESKRKELRCVRPTRSDC